LGIVARWLEVPAIAAVRVLVEVAKKIGVVQGSDLARKEKVEEEIGAGEGHLLAAGLGMRTVIPRQSIRRRIIGGDWIT